MPIASCRKSVPNRSVYCLKTSISFGINSVSIKCQLLSDFLQDLIYSFKGNKCLFKVLLIICIQKVFMQ